jgi:hypothetical protein
MQAHLDLTVKHFPLERTAARRKGIRDYARKIWSTIAKYVTYDEDAIFKDPNWPHLWS